MTESIRTAAVLGASGMLGRPVANELADRGFEVTVLARAPSKLAGFGSMRVVHADVFDRSSLELALRDQDVVYVNLGTAPGERHADRHTETDGLRNVVTAAAANGVRRLLFISSIVKDHQGRGGFHWWAFDVKEEALRIIRESSIPHTIFYPSSFMENFTHSQRRGNRILLATGSRARMYFIAAADYARQVAQSLELEDGANHEYVVQGPEAFNYPEAARVFVDNYRAGRLKISTVPLPLLRFLGLFSIQMKNGAKILEALNEYPETFRSEATWKELGEPQISLAEFARREGGK